MDKSISIKSFIITIACILIMASCQQVTVDFSFSPSQPKTGESVTFTNLSVNGEEYEWNFGDNRASSTKSTSHTYNKAGTYIVTLTEKDSKKSCQHVITVTDSVAGIGLSKEKVLRFDTVSLSAQVWNPYNHSVAYQWILNDDIQLIKGELNDKQIVVLFTASVLKSDTCTYSKVQLNITMDDITTQVNKQVAVYPSPSWAVLTRTAKNDYYQRLYPPYFEQPQTIDYNAYTILLDKTVATTVIKDELEKKTYTATPAGLYVENNNGENKTQIVSDSIGLVTLSQEKQYLFYATEQGVYMLPLIRTYNNQTKTIPVRINSINEVKNIVVSTELY